MCKHMFYKNVEGKEVILCKITNEMCGYQRYCSTRNRIIPNERWESCKLKDMKKIPEGSKFVKLKLKGYLYLEDNEKTIKVWNTLGEFNQDYVYIKEGIISNDYDLSLTPFEDKKIGRRKTNIEND